MKAGERYSLDVLRERFADLPPPLTADEVRAFCAVTLASYKVPEQVELRTEPLPRTANGKVMKQVLAGAENTFIEE